MKLIETIKDYKCALRIFTDCLKDEGIDVKDFFTKYSVKHQYGIVQHILTVHYNLSLNFTNSRYKIVLEKLLGDVIVMKEVDLLYPLDDDIYILAMRDTFEVFEMLLRETVPDLPF